MRLLLDTHALIWWLAGSPELPAPAREAIQSSATYVSAASAWEVATKARLGKLPHAGQLTSGFAERVRMEGFLGLPITLEHGERAGALPGSHRDPFDRMLIAQAQAENLVLVSNESLFDGYGVRRLW
jgi:PIN domain nuclease of toxin-antitoxin system